MKKIHQQIKISGKPKFVKATETISSPIHTMWNIPPTTKNTLRLLIRAGIFHIGVIIDQKIINLNFSLIFEN
jgi:hypothetical protein